MSLHQIPNPLVLGLLLAFVGYAALTGWPSMAIVERLALGGALLVLFFFTPILGMGAGAGALKLIAVAFVWLGVWDGLTFVAISMLSCGAVGFLVNKLSGTEKAMPYLPFAALAALLIAMPGSPFAGL